jgi:hypothetical protein
MAVNIVNLLANLLSPYSEGVCDTDSLHLTSYIAKYENVNLDADKIFYLEKRNVITLNDLRALLRCREVLPVLFVSSYWRVLKTKKDAQNWLVLCFGKISASETKDEILYA